MAYHRPVYSLVYFCLLFILVHASQTNSYEFNSRPVDVVVASNGQVYAVAGKTLYSLQPSLMPEQSFLLTAKDTVANKVALSSDESTLIICFRDGLCYTYPIDSLSDLDFVYEDGVTATIPDESIALTSGSTTPNQFYVGSSGYVHPGGNHIILLRTYEFFWEEESLLRSSENFVVTNSTFVSRDFYDAFASGPYVYFIAVDASTNLSSSGVKVMRVCNDANDTSFSAMIEVELQCSALGDSTINSVSVIEDFGGAAGRSVTVGFRGESTDRFCSFDISEIDSAMERVFQECVAGTHKIPLPWADYSLIAACSWFNEPEVTECDFGSSNSATFIQALAAPTPVLGTTMLELDSQENITSALALVVDGVSLLYVALTNQIGHSVTKYHITEEGTPLVLEAQSFMSPINLLEHGTEQIYAITETKILSFPLENCSSHSDCESCTTSSDPLCGWCVLEQSCSRRTFCEHASLDNRWVTQYPKCITDIGITEEYLEANSPLSVGVYISPMSAVLPTLTSNEHYACSFTNQRFNYSFQFLYQSEAGVCMGEEHDVPSFNGVQIEMTLSLLSPKQQVLQTSDEAIPFYNCSHLSSCRECEKIAVCGWCVYDHACKATQSMCQYPNLWITKENGLQQNETSMCPVVLPPIKGRYVYPVAVEGNFTLRTRHLPPPITDLKYACRLQYKNRETIITNATYDSASDSEQITCHVSRQQIFLSSISKAVGIERLSLSLLWLDRAGDVQYEFEYIRMTNDIQHDNSELPAQAPDQLPLHDMVIYNCSQLANSCSSCLAVNIGTDFDCGWCSSGQSSRCTAIPECFQHFVQQPRLCPSPQIISISPTSGHIEGGTRVTITGTDLGVRVNDVMEVMFGNSPCIIQPLLYVPGTSIVCNTSRSNVETEVNVSVQINRTSLDFLRATYPSFTYALPTISSVFPPYGPVSGGTRVTIRGSELDISDTALTTATVAGVECRNMSVSNLELVCTTSPSIIQVGLVLVQIDGHNISGERYSYVKDPVYHSVHPQNTIPAGGILLMFTGDDFNITQQPRLEITIGNAIFSSVCYSRGATTLQCIAPQLPLETEVSERLSYTIVMDDAPGPSMDNGNLRLGLRPNPVFVEIYGPDRVYQGPTDSITLLGTNLDAVQISEIEVTIGEHVCDLTLREHNNTHLVFQCRQMNFPQSATTTVDVKVTVGDGALEYDVGRLQYIPPHNCSQLASSCSSCLALTSTTGFRCGWCNRDGQQDSCSHVDGCLTHFISGPFNQDSCLPPRISTISPTSGHIEGGTRVTITGTDLGVRVDDVMEVMFGNSPCIIQPLLYVPGARIVCITTQSNKETAVNVTVEINRGSIGRATYPSFTYALPTISSVFPLYGPASGGTRVTIRGSELDISDTALTTATVAGVECRIMSISHAEIVCTTSPSTAIQLGRFELNIDGHTIFGERYSYTPNPQFSTLHPQNTIPVGGVILTFTGQNLNVTQEPRLIITIGSTIYHRECTAQKPTTLRCTAPPLPVLGGSNTSSISLLNYTIIMDDVPGPSTDNTHLELRVRPNPVFVGIQESDQEYMGSEDRITILGMNLDSVDSSEIGLRMNGKVCTTTSILLLPSRAIVECDPPDFSDLEDNMIQVKVVVANGTLEYDVGTLQYIAPSGFDFSKWAPLVYALLGILVLLATIAVCAVLIICLVCILKRSNSRESTGSPQTTELNLSDNGYLGGLGSSENVYDSIPDTMLRNALLTRETSFPSNFVFQADDICHSESESQQQPNNNKGVSKRPRRGSLPPIPIPTVNDDYIVMRSHSVSNKEREELKSPKRHSISYNERNQPSLNIHYTTDYVDMVPGMTESRRGGPNTFNFITTGYNPEETRCLTVGYHGNIMGTTVAKDATSESSA